MNNNDQNSQSNINLTNFEIACGNCWGHQQYVQGFREQKIDHWRGRRDNFISRFIKRFIKS